MHLVEEYINDDSYWKINVVNFNIKSKLFLNNIRMEGELNFFWYGFGTLVDSF